ncbi:hypothetical protein WMY93_012999 [Mugilogobius chulae]|uniref:Uncharacterized protein n=1 Tax=Mugilogobius chulae TaxID=88201 RepID=A0AAW0P0E9_9GOBI
MKTLYMLLVCCSLWWAAAARRQCDTKLDLRTNSSSLSEGMGDIHKHSLSPWTWKSTTFPMQIPSVLWEAECSSSVCWYPSADRQGTETEAEAPGVALSAVPIYQNVLVLEKRPGSPCFTTAFRRLAVGCTCVRAQTITN